MSDFTSSTPDDQPPAVPNPAAAPPPQAPQAPMPPQAPQAPQAPQYQPPPGAVQYPQQPPGAPPPYAQPPAGAPAGPPVSRQGQPLADWGTRALGWLVDFAIVLPVAIVAGIFEYIVPFLGYLFDLVVFAVWVLFALQIGDTGQSPGMRLIGLKCISAKEDQTNGQNIGGGLGVVRLLACFVNSIICYVGWLFPLWDSRRQTVADKIMTTEVIIVPKQAFSLFPAK